MKGSMFRLCFAAVLSGLAGAAPAPSPDKTVQERATTKTTLVIPAGTLIGSVTDDVENYAGIPFAEAPTGSLRLRPPVRLSSSFGTLDATGTGPACPQMYFSTSGNDFVTEVLSDLTDNPLFQTVSDETEDCLTMRVQRPAGTSPDAALPVLFWMFGGGFELGSPQMYDATSLVAQGVSLGQPFIFVSVNYRVGGFGFMPGAEILANGSANLGLLDQRMGLEWTADNIAAFGGDPTKVTIWGESAGAISVFDQMALYDGDNTYNGSALFRGGIMNSGSITPAEPIDGVRAQGIYDAVVAEGGCSAAADTLECLRGLDYDTFLSAANSVPGILGYTGLALSYLPRPDGTVLTASPDELAKAGKYSAVPMIIGDQEDEGTLFGLFTGNITTQDDLIEYLQSVLLANTTVDLVTELVNTYSADQSAGSPFRTGVFNDIYPEFKRLTAILGDLAFTLARRLFLTYAAAANPDVPSWSYLASYDYGTPVLGTFHGSDILQVFYGVLPNYASNAIQTHYINFLYNLDPNVGVDNATLTEWPRWADDKMLMQFNAESGDLLADDFRADSYDWIAANIDSLFI